MAEYIYYAQVRKVAERNAVNGCRWESALVTLDVAAGSDEVTSWQLFATQPEAFANAVQRVKYARAVDA